MSEENKAIVAPWFTDFWGVAGRSSKVRAKSSPHVTSCRVNTGLDRLSGRAWRASGPLRVRPFELRHGPSRPSMPSTATTSAAVS